MCVFLYSHCFPQHIAYLNCEYMVIFLYNFFPYLCYEYDYSICQSSLYHLRLLQHILLLLCIEYTVAFLKTFYRYLSYECSDSVHLAVCLVWEFCFSMYTPWGVVGNSNDEWDGEWDF